MQTDTSFRYLDYLRRQVIGNNCYETVGNLRRDRERRPSLKRLRHPGNATGVRVEFLKKMLQSIPRTHSSEGVDSDLLEVDYGARV